jgi:phosphatidylserine/phosphatidylglycerophosphate/cardiolipin synthase-like enzyme
VARRTRRSGRSRRRSSGRGAFRRFETLVVGALVIAGGYAYLDAHGELPKGTALPGSSAQATQSGPAQVQPAPPPGSSAAFVFSTASAAEPTIYNAIDSARTSIDMTMYELSDNTVESDLIARHKAGANVRVVLDQAEKSLNQAAYNTLTSSGVGVVWSSTQFAYTHQKTVTIDDRESLILTGNLTSSDYTTTRDYGVVDTDPHDVAAIVAVFNSDYTHGSITPGDADDLLWSPTSAESRLLAVINGAKKTLDVEGEEFSDSTVVKAIAARAKAGVAVRVVVETPSQYASEIKEVVAAGGKVVGYSSSKGLYIHAKALVADVGLSDQTVELGSMNLTAASLGRNRELGIILTSGSACSLINSQFNSDFSGGAAQS